MKAVSPDWRPERDNDVPVIDCGNEEKHCLMYYYAMETQAGIGRMVFEKRLKKLPQKYRKAYSTGMYFLRRAFDGIWLSLPAKTEENISRVLKSSVVELKPQYSVDKNVEIVDRGDFREVCNMVIADRCSICMLEDRDAKRCKLRKIMMRVCPPAVLPDNVTHCPFWDVAASHSTGDYFTASDILNYEASAEANKTEG